MTKWTDKAEFKATVYDYADKMKIKVKSLALRPMTNKWASCSTDGNLNFNKELLDIDKELGEYVIVHEMVHLLVPTHNDHFLALMNKYYPNWREARLELNELPLGHVEWK